MKQSIPWILIIILLLGIVGGLERKHQILETDLNKTIKQYEFRIDNLINDAAELETQLQKSYLHRSIPFQDDLNKDEFIQLLIDYMAADGRCEVVIEKLDWSTWADYYGG